MFSVKKGGIILTLSERKATESGSKLFKPYKECFSLQTSLSEEVSILEERASMQQELIWCAWWASWLPI